MNLNKIIETAFDSGWSSSHDTKTMKQWDKERDTFLEDYEEQIAALLPQWISVKDEMPEVRRWVMVYIPERKMAFMAHAEKGVWYSTFEEARHLKITHWMPLPEGPTT